MKRLLVLVLVAALGWSGFWTWASLQRKAAFADWFEARAAEGWVAEYADLSVGGFPNRLDTSILAPTLADPHSGLAWTAEELQVLGLSYDARHQIFALRGPQRLTTEFTSTELSHALFRGSFVTTDPQALPLERLRVEGRDWILRAPEAETQVAEVALAVDHTEGTRYRVALDLGGYRPALPQAIRQRLQIPDLVNDLRADLHVTFDAPLDAAALAGTRPQPTALDLRLAQLRWGAMELHAAGNLTLDAKGLAEGEITLRLTNWREMLDLARAWDGLPPELPDLAEEALTLIARLSGTPDKLDLPIAFAGGRTRLGPIPVGPAPRLAIPW
ncbi:DUF2125 domain-containing protein [Mesobacterium pallidum]|uniref:DUF2125 domain-containing protein n=1 Tax=Mesobacterium pallidum TaxID=2872037 RepID=UPI001EE260B4|nr:DUF2125 domain-containing protein [Mesobacterium pallidum]